MAIHPLQYFKGKEEEMKLYTVYMQRELNNHKKSNSIHTTRYSWWNFIFKSLLEQFLRIANCYFLVVAILSSIPDISPVSPLTAFVPIILVLFISMTKDALEDLMRRKLDRKVNNLSTHVWRRNEKDNLNEFSNTSWKNVKLGEIVKVNNNELIPCDLLLLKTSSCDGLCFVETSNLDGETNLKPKMSIPSISDYFERNQASELTARVDCDEPNENIYSFSGRFIENQQVTFVGIDQLCLRGSSLGNTEYIFGMAIYVGNETKIMKNSKKTAKKTTKLEKLTNKYILVTLLIEILLILVGMIGYIVWTKISGSKMWYLHMSNDGQSEMSDGDLVFGGFKMIFTIFILINNMIPISLYITIEFTKYFQGLLMEKDLKFFDSSDSGLRVRNLLHEDLGQIEYLFSDKTGTLTRNQMDCVKFSIGEKIYGQTPNNSVDSSECSFSDDRIDNGKWNNLSNNDFFELFMLLACCNSIMIEGSPPNQKFHATSPDELALVQFCLKMGVQLMKRNTTEIVVRIHSQPNYQDYVFTILETFEFTSDRKRQSILVKDQQDLIFLYAKGADCVIFPILEKHDDNLFNQRKVSIENVNIMGKEGLRTLVCAKTRISNQFYQNWKKRFESSNDSNEKESLINEIEGQLNTIVGITGIEDKLQDHVPETIINLRKAGINIWILTGDKKETALNIGSSCGLLNDSEATVKSLEGSSESEIEKSLCNLEKENYPISLVVEGNSLEYLLTNQVICKRFIDLTHQSCHSVIISRASPKQKADIVQAVKKFTSTNCLAIGDGANDCAMLQKADIGCGIIGKEGMQASNVSDYAFSQFFHLERLLLIHGRWNYRRISKLILLIFYKNIMFFLSQFWFLFHNGFSGNSFHDKWNISLHNTLFTAFQVSVFAIFDRDLEEDFVLKHSQVYKKGQFNNFVSFY